MATIRNLSILAVILLAGQISFSANVAESRVILKERISYYSVSGSTGREIYKNMVAKGPKLDGLRGHALATTEYKYDIKNVKVGVEKGRCIPKTSM